jgi:hypothetical protein
MPKSKHRRKPGGKAVAHPGRGDIALPGWALALPVPPLQSEPMPQALNVRHLPGFSEGWPIIPSRAVYIGRRNARYRLPASKWANPFMVRRARTAWQPPWCGWGGRSWRATREFSRSARDAEKPAPKLDPTYNSRVGPADRRKEDALNKTRSGKAVLRTGGLTELEAAARAVNAEPWEPPPGMVRRQCPWCRHFFAAPASSQELRCQDCVDKLPRGPRRPV